MVFTVNGKTVDTLTNLTKAPESGDYPAMGGILERGGELELIFDTKVTSSTPTSQIARYSIDFSFSSIQEFYLLQGMKDHEWDGWYHDWYLEYPELFDDLAHFEHFSENFSSRQEYERYEADFPRYAGDAGKNNLARAIEVYEFIEGEYRFISYLDQYARGERQIEGTIGVSYGLSTNPYTNFVDTTRIRLVYSEAAGEYFENKAFIIKMEANHSLLRADQVDRHYVATETQLVSAASLRAMRVGKTIVLTNNITLTETLTFPFKTGIDLNGNTLTLSNADIKISFDDDTLAGLGLTPAQEAAYNAFRPGIYDRNQRTTGTLNGIRGNGKIIVDCPDGFIFVQDSLDGESMGNIVVENHSFDALFKEMEAQAKRAEADTLFAGQKIDFHRNLNYYFATGKLFADISGDESAFISLEGIDHVVNPLYRSEMTLVRSFIVSINDDGANTRQLSLNLTICGQSPWAIADYILGLIPRSIKGSIFLPAFDPVTKATLTWVAREPLYLDDNGSYLVLGQDGSADPISIEDFFDDWSDVYAVLGLIVDFQGEQFFGWHSEEMQTWHYKEILINIEIFDARERTDRIFTNRQIILDEEEVSLDLMAEGLAAKPLIVPRVDNAVVTLNAYLKDPEKRRVQIPPVG
jgi:hypothetical protein